MYSFANTGRPASPGITATIAVPVPTKAAEEAMRTQVAQWDSEMDSIDRKQEQLLNEQWKLLRAQMNTLMSSLTEVRAELTTLKANTLTKDKENVILGLVGSYEEHGKLHAGVLERVSYLENFVGESADKHAEFLSASRVAHMEIKEHKTSMDTRLEYIESLIGDTADKHAKELGMLKEFSQEAQDSSNKISSQTGKHARELERAGEQIEELHRRIANCAQAEHHATMEQRVKFIEGRLGESVDRQDKHKANVETRLEYLETMIGDNADKHFSEIEAAKRRCTSLESGIQAFASKDHASSMEKRMVFLEKCLGESADKHDAHKTTMETRLKFLETLIGDNADKHKDQWDKQSKELEAAQGKLNGVTEAVKACAKVEHASSIEKRMAFIEQCLGESVDKHDVHKANMEGRVKYLETLIGDTADKHWKEIQAAQRDIQSAHDKANGLEGKLKGHERTVGNMDLAMKNHATVGQTANMEQRMTYMERLLGESADKHDNHKVSMEGRLKYLEDLIGDNADKHWKEIQAAHKKLGSIDDAVSSCAKAEQHDHLHKRLAALEAAGINITPGTLTEYQTVEVMAKQMQEQWERDVKTRTFNQDACRDLIQQERSVREAIEQTIESRVRQLEDIISRETSRLWTAVECRSKEVVVQRVQSPMPMSGMSSPVPVLEVLPNAQIAAGVPMYNAQTGVLTSPVSPVPSERARLLSRNISPMTSVRVPSPSGRSTARASSPSARYPSPSARKVNIQSVLSGGNTSQQLLASTVGYNGNYPGNTISPTSRASPTGSTSFDFGTQPASLLGGATAQLMELGMEKTIGTATSNLGSFG